MEDGYISSPRPFFKDDPEKIEESKSRLKMGGTSAGIVVDVTETGLTVNGYYQSFNNREVYYACVSDCVEISWDELEKIRKNAGTKTKRKKVARKTLEPDLVEKPTEEYLESLPIVTINKKKYYLDVELRQRRPCDRPERVFNY